MNDRNLDATPLDATPRRRTIRGAWQSARDLAHHAAYLRTADGSLAKRSWLKRAEQVIRPRRTAMRQAGDEMWVPLRDLTFRYEMAQEAVEQAAFDDMEIDEAEAEAQRERADCRGGQGETWQAQAAIEGPSREEVIAADEERMPAMDRKRDQPSAQRDMEAGQ